MGLILSASSLSAVRAAPVQISFWHSMEGVKDVVAGYADAFNRSQGEYRVTATAVGNYREAPVKLQAAIRSGTPPVLFQAEFTIFNKLAANGQFLNLGGLNAGLPPELVGDFYPAVWKAGVQGGVRYGLPWNLSTPVLFYNAGVLRQAGVTPPRSWSELETLAARLRTGGRRPLLSVADAWTFEGMVAARGGELVQGGKPAFTSPEAVAALEQLARMVGAGSAQTRTLDQALGAAFDFARGHNLMAVASAANLPDFAKLPFVELGVAPFPCEKVCAPPIGGANLAVVRGATPQQQAGALAFWRFLMEPARLADWVKASAYASPRRSVQPLLESYYARNPSRRLAPAQLETAVPRPSAPGYADWQKLLEEAITKASSGQLSARDALQEAQRRATGQ